MIKATNLIPTGIAWIPEIPKDWELKRIKLLFDFNKNIVGKTSANYDVLSLTTKGVIKRDLESGMGKFPASFDGYQIVKPNSIMLCLFDMDVTPRVVGHVDDEGIISAAYTNIIPKKGINSKYYYYYFLLQDKNKSLLALGTGIRITLNKDFFGTLKIPVPPLSVQNSIVAYLDKKNEQIDTFIRNKERLIELLEEEKKSIIINSVSKGIGKFELDDFGNDWLGPLPKHWGIKRNKLLFRKTKNIIGNKSSDYKVLSLSVNGVIERDLESNFGKMPTTFDDYQVIHPDTLLLCLFDIDVTPRGIGYVGQLGITSAAYTNLIKIDKCINLEYYYYWFLSLDFNKRLLQFATNLRNTVLMDVFGALYSPYPPIDEQNEIVKYIKFEVAKLETAIKNAKAEIASIKEYREALITDLVTGKRGISG